MRRAVNSIKRSSYTRVMVVGVGLSVLALLAAGCGSKATPTAAPPTATSPPATSTRPPATATTAPATSTAAPATTTAGATATTVAASPTARPTSTSVSATATVTSVPATTSPPTATATRVPATPTAGGNAANGQVVFNQFCNACHPGGNAGVGPRILNVSRDKLFTAVRSGKGIMPAFSTSQISDQQLLDVLAYLTR